MRAIGGIIGAIVMSAVASGQTKDLLPRERADKTIIVKGFVLEEEGAPAGGLRVQVFPNSGDYIPMQIVRNDGTFSFSVPETSRFHLMVGRFGETPLALLQNLSGLKNQEVSVSVESERGFAFGDRPDPVKTLDLLTRVIGLNSQGLRVKDPLLEEYLNAPKLRQELMKDNREVAVELYQTIDGLFKSR